MHTVSAIFGRFDRFSRMRYTEAVAVVNTNVDTIRQSVYIFVYDLAYWRYRMTGKSNRNSYLLRKYGITEQDYNNLLAAQGGVCAICGRPPKPGGRRLNVDHDHRLRGRSSVRGLLCGGRYQGCNRKLGRIDEVGWLRAAAGYIAEPPARKVLATVGRCGKKVAAQSS